MEQNALSELVAELLVAINLISGQPVPAEQPRVEFVPAATIQSRACDRPCQVYGWFPPGRTIYLDDRLRPDEDSWSKSILLHELVHYLQQESAAFSELDACRRWAFREHEAYRVQARWLAGQGTMARPYNGFGRPPWRLPCSDEADLKGNAAEAAPE